MEANLIFKSTDGIKQLKTANLKDLDEETYQLRHIEKLKDKYNLGTSEGEFLISYEPDTLPITELYLYNYTNEEIEGEKYLSVDFETRPYLIDFKKDIYLLLNDFANLKRFYETIKDNFSAEENLYFTYGVAYQNKELCLKVLENFLVKRFESEEGYFFARLIKDSIKKTLEETKADRRTK